MQSYISIINQYYTTDSELYNLLILHSQSVMSLAIDLARRANLNVDFSLLASGAMLHDIGIIATNAPSIHCNGNEHYMRHGIIGAQMLRKFGLEKEARICERHIGSGLSADEIITQKLPLDANDYLCATLEEMLVCYADNFFSKSNCRTTPFKHETVRAKMERYGTQTLQRFDQMTRLFGTPDSF